MPVANPISIRPVEPAKLERRLPSRLDDVNHPNNFPNAPAGKPALQPAGSLLTAAHTHGPALAIIGGPSNVKIKNVAVINGATMNRKP